MEVISVVNCRQERNIFNTEPFNIGKFHDGFVRLRHEAEEDFDRNLVKHSFFTNFRKINSCHKATLLEIGNREIHSTYVRTGNREWDLDSLRDGCGLLGWRFDGKLVGFLGSRVF
jgi:hypothetical protein